jgi:hypothetical protein
VAASTGCGDRRGGAATVAGVKLLLLHPPLLSPAVFRRLVPLLVEAGHEVQVPRLRFDQVDRWWQQAGQAAVAAMPAAEAVVAYSGAGVLVPVVVAALPSARAVVLVDAVLPAAAGATRTSAELREMVRQLAVDGVLPPWTSWWAPQELADVLPDPHDCAILAEEAPALPEAFYDVPVPAPPGWEPQIRGYLHLSPAYQDAAAQAHQRGWHTRELPGQHLDPLTRPAAVAAALLPMLAGE